MLAGVFIGLGLVVVAFLIALFNMRRMASFQNNIETGFKLHLVSMGGVFIGGLVAVVCGIGFLFEKFAH